MAPLVMLAPINGLTLFLAPRKRSPRGGLPPFRARGWHSLKACLLDGASPYRRKSSQAVGLGPTQMRLSRLLGRQRPHDGVG
jgi:hypothetical protein